MKTIIAASLLLAVTSSVASAATPWIDARQNAQSYRIAKGFQSGRLTWSETAKLAQGQARVQNLENQAKADGVVTPYERARIHTAQSIQSARIFIKKHN